MAKRCDLGTNCSIDFDRLIESRLLIQANSGAGKSWLIRKLAEETYGRAPQIIIDRDGEYHTLRERFDYVLAGKGGDCPADVKSAAMLAHKLLQLGASAIIDVYELGIHRAEFVRRFLDALVNAPRELWHPTLIILDEAHEFCPEVGSAVSTDAVKTLMALGRKRGFCGVLATQRIAKLHKDAAAECNNKLIGRSSQDIDMKRAANELGFTSREDIQSLRQLGAGEFYAFGPALTNVVTLTKIGNVKTTHLRAGERALPPVAPRKTILKTLAQLADLPQEAEEEARTSAEWRTKAKQLEAELKRARATQPAAKVEVIEKKVVTDAQIKQANEIFMKAMKISGDLADALRSVTGAKPPEYVQRNATPTIATTREKMQLPPKPVAKPQPTPRSDDGELKPAELKILGAIAWFEAIGQASPSSTAVAFIAGYTENGHFNNMRGKLHSGGFITYPRGGLMALTDTGRAIAPMSAVEKTNSGVFNFVRQHLNPALCRLLDPAIDAYPNAISVEDLAASAGYTVNGHFNNMRGKLKTLGLVTYPQNGYVRAADLLFPFGVS